MSIGSWDPSVANSETSFEFDRDLLKRAIRLAEADDFDAIESLIPQEQRQHQSRMMTLAKEAWFDEAKHYDDNELAQLIRFFTLAEMRLPGWEAGAQSPVVWLVKVLRQRGNPPSRELQLWIKANTSNKFLPNGALF